MNVHDFTLLLAAPPSGAGGASGGSSVVSLVTFGLLFLVMYTVLIRPQSRRKKQHRQQLEMLNPGDKIATIGGIHGTVAHVEQTYVIVKVDDNAKIKFSKEAIGTVFPKSNNSDAGQAKQKEAAKPAADEQKQIVESKAAAKPAPKKKTSTTAKTSKTSTTRKKTSATKA